MRGSVKHVDPPDAELSEGPAQWAVYLYTCFLQGLFNHLPHGFFRWEPDLKDTEVVITGEQPLDADAIQKCPHLVVLRGPYKWANLSLDKMRNTEAFTGNRTHTDLVAGTMGVFCIAEEGMEAGRLADIVFRATVYHRRLLQKTGGFHKIGHDLSAGPETPPGALIRDSSEVEGVMVEVSVPWFLQWTWTSELIVPPQKTTLGLIFNEPRASDVVKPPFDVLNDAKLLAHYGVANNEEAESEFGLRALLTP